MRGMVVGEGGRSSRVLLYVDYYGATLMKDCSCFTYRGLTSVPRLKSNDVNKGNNLKQIATIDKTADNKNICNDVDNNCKIHIPKNVVERATMLLIIGFYSLKLKWLTEIL